jgi:hypothetical protein
MKIITRDQAIQQGLKMYCHGKKCRAGHIAERYVTDSSCLECRKIKAKKYAEARIKEIRQGMIVRPAPKKEPTIPGARIVLGRCQSAS